MVQPFDALPEQTRKAAEAMFGDQLPRAEAFAQLLSTDGVVRGLIGPREAPRIWERHLLNCGAMASMLDPGDAITDVGSGAGLPGIVLAILRPDVEMTLVEPLARRTVFLEEAVESLDLTERVSVVRARAEDVAARPSMFHVKQADVVTARAVAPLDRLVGWCLPLARLGGRLLALKGSSAADEVAEYAAAIKRLGGGVPRIHRIEVGTPNSGLDPAVVVEVARERAAAVVKPSQQKPSSRQPSR